MKTKIQIKTTLGSLLFEFEEEDNSVKDTLIEASDVWSETIPPLIVGNGELFIPSGPPVMKSSQFSQRSRFGT